MKSRRKLGPYSQALQPGIEPVPFTPPRDSTGSRVIRRGTIGDRIDGRSRDGRLMRHMEAELVKHLGGNPSFVQRMMIERVVKIRMQLDLLDEKLANGWTGHDSRTYGALLNALRLSARELGLIGPHGEQRPAPSLEEVMCGSKAMAAP